jgi:hypothetical protein
MANYPLNKIVFNKEMYVKTIDTSFSQINPPSPPVENTMSVNDFFNLYNTLFYQIPISGSINSHQYLVEQSGQYIGSDIITADVQALLDEITSLRQDLLAANQQILTLQTSVNVSSSVI